MKVFPAAEARRHFGELLSAVGQGPVAIEKYGEVCAIGVAPGRFEEQADPKSDRGQRHHARLGQQLIERDRLIHHQRIAIDLLKAPLNTRKELIRDARATVERWRKNSLSSSDYIDRWAEILRMPLRRMADAMTSDADGWGPALRQNSPWIRPHAGVQPGNSSPSKGDSVLGLRPAPER